MGSYGNKGWWVVLVGIPRKSFPFCILFAIRHLTNPPPMRGSAFLTYPVMMRWGCYDPLGWRAKHFTGKNSLLSLLGIYHRCFWYTMLPLPSTRESINWGYLPGEGICQTQRSRICWPFYTATSNSKECLDKTSSHSLSFGNCRNAPTCIEG